MRSQIKTDRLELRFMESEDALIVNRLSRHKDIYRNVGHLPPDIALSDTRDWIAGHAKGRDSKTDFVYAVAFMDEIIGCVGCHRRKIEDDFALGYWLSPRHWGEGFMIEATKAVLIELDKCFGPHSIKAGYFFDNPASGRILQKLGFSKAGESMEHCLGRGEKVNHINMLRKLQTELAP